MKVERRLFLLLILSSVLATMFLASLSSTAHATTSTQFIIQPAQPSNINFYANFTTLPTAITFNITVANVTSLGSWQVGVEWDETLLSYTSISLPTDNVFAGQGPITAGPFTEVLGQVVYGAACGPGQPGFNGSGILAQIVLAIDTPVQAPASCPVDFEGVTVDTFLTALNLADIPFTAVTSTFSYQYLYGTVVTHTISGSSNLAVTESNGTIASNSATIDTVNHTISFNVTGTAGDTDFLYVQIPKDVINVTALSQWKWYLSGIQQSASSLQITDNATYTNVLIPQFEIEETSAGDTVGIQGTIPELSGVLAILTIASASTVAIVKNRTKKK